GRDSRRAILTYGARLGRSLALPGYEISGLELPKTPSAVACHASRITFHVSRFTYSVSHRNSSRIEPQVRLYCSACQKHIANCWTRRVCICKNSKRGAGGLWPFPPRCL